MSLRGPGSFELIYGGSWMGADWPNTGVYLNTVYNSALPNNDRIDNITTGIGNKLILDSDLHLDNWTINVSGTAVFKIFTNGYKILIKNKLFLNVIGTGAALSFRNNGRSGGVGDIPGVGGAGNTVGGGLWGGNGGWKLSGQRNGGNGWGNNGICLLGGLGGDGGNLASGGATIGTSGIFGELNNSEFSHLDFNAILNGGFNGGDRFYSFLGGAGGGGGVGFDPGGIGGGGGGGGGIVHIAARDFTVFNDGDCSIVATGGKGASGDDVGRR